MIEPTRRRGLSDPYGSWKIICMPRRYGRIADLDSLLRSAPSKMRRPAVSGYRRMIERASVDFPHPVSPTRPRVSPRCTSRLTPSTALTVPTVRLKKIPCLIGKCLTIPSARSSTSVPAVESGMDGSRGDGGDDAGKPGDAGSAMCSGVAPARGVHGDADAGQRGGEPARRRVIDTNRDGLEIGGRFDAPIHREWASRVEPAPGWRVDETRRCPDNRCETAAEHAGR